MTQAVDEWSRDPALDAEDEDEDEIIYDDDEDEFGLPRIAGTRRKQSKSMDSFQVNPSNSGGGFGNNASALGFGLAAGNRHRADSSDIAEERGPLYPTTRKGEGKILRPQYKDILKGNSRSFSGRDQHVLILATKILQIH